MQKRFKLNRLQRHLPDGLVADAAWLQQHGYSTSLRAKYAANGWLEQVARGVYRRPAAKLAPRRRAQEMRWQQAVVSLQMLLGRPFTVGGRTALELQGFAHYLTTRAREAHLYSAGKPPGWTANLPLDARLVFHNAQKLFSDSVVAAAKKVTGRNAGKNDVGPLPGGLMLQTWGDREWPLVLSSPERATLELLDEVPKSETFHQVDVLMEGLANLSPRRMQTLLEDCHNVKVKRLFFWFADRHQHAWLKAIDRRKIDLGKGKRMLVRGGRLDPTYHITVPGAMDAGI